MYSVSWCLCEQAYNLCSTYTNASTHTNITWCPHWQANTEARFPRTPTNSLPWDLHTRLGKLMNCNPRVSSNFGTATKLRAGQSGVQIPVGTQALHLLQNRPGRVCGSRSLLPDMYPESLPGVQRQEHEADGSPPLARKLSINAAISYTSSPTTYFHGMDRQNFSSSD
jgi:hypothetical protein